MNTQKTIRRTTKKHISKNIDNKRYKRNVDLKKKKTLTTNILNKNEGSFKGKLFTIFLIIVIILIAQKKKIQIILKHLI